LAQLCPVGQHRIMNLAITDLSRLRRRKFVAEMFMLGCAILAFGWIGAGLVLILGDAELRQHIFRIFEYLWLSLGAVPLCCFFVGWGGRSLLMRKISEIDSYETKDAA
jgi:hypothetical protein